MNSWFLEDNWKVKKVDDHELVLLPVSLTDEAQALALHRDHRWQGFDFLLGYEGQDWASYVDRLALMSRGLELAGRVPSTFLLAWDGGGLVGRVSIRHALNDHLWRVGGHVGYGVHPDFRGRGYASLMLAQGLVVARSLGVGDALLTCAESNAASARVIEKCGGVLAGAGEVAAPGKRRYWIRLPAGDPPAPALRAR